eukprot:TRINITY_DN15786_c0_g1_i6.p2 TRINITY_DN15786_c0_g1~~TRINITY_DN15786_c0_g1_i6.p2  ORF type:complete len:236 (-),score=-15.45 TRINITY_DN15786_c0_g1_i6:525-1232(-)
MVAQLLAYINMHNYNCFVFFENTNSEAFADINCTQQSIFFNAVLLYLVLVIVSFIIIRGYFCSLHQVIHINLINYRWSKEKYRGIHAKTVHISYNLFHRTSLFTKNTQINSAAQPVAQQIQKQYICYFSISEYLIKFVRTIQSYAVLFFNHMQYYPAWQSVQIFLGIQKICQQFVWICEGSGQQGYIVRVIVIDGIYYILQQYYYSYSIFLFFETLVIIANVQQYSVHAALKWIC